MACSRTTVPFTLMVTSQRAISHCKVRYFLKVMGFLDIIHHPDFFERLDISETGFYLRLQVKSTLSSHLIELVTIFRLDGGISSIFYVFFINRETYLMIF
jgi:hypothetical protein